MNADKKNSWIDLILFFLLTVIGILFSILYIVISFPFMHFQRKKWEKKYSASLSAYSGKNFFCYNNRKNSKEYIEENIIPYLSDKIEIVYLDGRSVHSGYPSEFISAALYNLRHYHKFPHLMKIRNGKLIDQSVNPVFYTVLNQYKPKSKLLDEINRFFEIE